MSKTFASLVASMLMAAPFAALAQSAAVVPVDESAAPLPDADSSTSGTTRTQPDDSQSGSDSAASTGSSETSSTTSTGDSAPDSASTADSGSPAREKFKVYLGADRTQITLDLSDDNLKQRYGRDKVDGGFYRVRAGVRLLPGIGVEAQGGFLPDDAHHADEFKAGHFYAAYVTTTGTLLDTVEVSARAGYAWLGAARAGGSGNFDGLSYGVELDLPIRVISESLPDLRVSVGGTVFTQENSERSYGWSYGLRYDFGL